MGDTTRTWVSWSSGKDCTYALAEARADPRLEVTGLLVTINADADRVAMHATRRSLLRQQARSLGLALHVVEIPSPCPNEVYEQRMAQAWGSAYDEGVRAVVFGDLHLADVRAYRESALSGSGITPVFPLWGRATGPLAHDMVAGGTRAMLTCLDPTKLPARLAGHGFDEELLARLPADVDPCGENGEFHTFVFDGPGFAYPLDVAVGDVVERDGFVFADVRTR